MADYFEIRPGEPVFVYLRLIAGGVIERLMKKQDGMLVRAQNPVVYRVDKDHHVGLIRLRYQIEGAILNIARSEESCVVTAEAGLIGANLRLPGSGIIRAILLLIFPLFGLLASANDLVQSFVE